LHELRLDGGVHDLVDLDVGSRAARCDPEVAGHLATGDRDVVVLEVPAHHDQLGRADELVPADNGKPDWPGRKAGKQGADDPHV
jgi:hypothetical protein